MSILHNCVYLTCDRCKQGMYYDSITFVKNIGWSLDTKIPDEKPMDLCPKCNEQWGNLIHNFLYGELDLG